MDMTEKNAKQLAYAGIVPFVILALGCWNDQFSLYAGRWLAGYAAVILSFVGAVHWGIALVRPQEERRLLFSILPALSGWLVLMVSIRLALPALAIAFVMVWQTEREQYFSWLPDWYLQLRSRVTVAVAACLIVGWAGYLT